MSNLIKEKYNKIKVSQDKIENVINLLDLYIEEFCEDHDCSEKEFVMIVLNFSRDFLEGKLSENQVYSLTNGLLFSERTKKYFEITPASRNNLLISFVFELDDIIWMKDSNTPEAYYNYLENLKNKWGELISYYQRFLGKEN